MTDEIPVRPMTDSSQSTRIVQLDVLRGFAVLGIFWIAVAAFGLPYGANALPTLLGTISNTNLFIWAFTDVFLEGAMRGLFSILFGASAMIYLEKAEQQSGQLIIYDRYVRRNVLLMLFGLIHAWFLLWPYDVLFPYGLIGLFLFPLRNTPSKILLVVACLGLLFANLEVDPQSILDDWRATKMEESTVLPLYPSLDNSAEITAPDPQFLNWLRQETARELALYRSGYADIFVAQADEVIANQSIILYRKNIFDIGAMMLLGIVLYRWGVLSGNKSRLFYALLLLFGYSIGGVLRGADVVAGLMHGFDTQMVTKMERVDYDLGRLPVALGHIGIIGLICSFRSWDWLTKALAAVGRLALTHYISQTAIAITLFYGFGFGLYGHLERIHLMLICLTVWALQIGFSLAWLRTFRIGPLEWVWRSLIYGAPQPLLLRSRF